MPISLPETELESREDLALGVIFMYFLSYMVEETCHYVGFIKN